MYSFKHKALDVCESLPVHSIDEVSTNPDSAYTPLFIRLAQKTRNQQTNNCSLINR